ncbi:MAG: rhomboid family intramembrane serine protease [Cytophagales bacterium]|nr:rhomboid family intramembrane serine protease [Cytophagales bacterium]
MNFNLTPIIKAILIINVAVFAIMSLARYNMQIDLRPYIYLFPLKTEHFLPTQLVTFMIAHAGFGHLLGNMLPFLFLGPLVEQRIGPKKMIILYVVTGMGSGLFYMLLKQYISPNELVPLVGASGATFGLLMALGLYFPEERIIIFPLPIPIKIKYFVLFYGAFEVYNTLQNRATGVAHEAHLIGLALAFLLVYIWSKKGNQQQRY